MDSDIRDRDAGGMSEEIIATKLRAWREWRNMTLEALGEKVDKSASQLSQIETGKRGTTLATLRALATALNTDIASLIAIDPKEQNELLPLWRRANPQQRDQIVKHAKIVLNTEA
jgi:XRE family transcriptional regulator, fatty acid utilization regulator